MANVRILRGDYNPRRINKYVPGMQFHSQVDNGSGFYGMSFGTPIVASNTNMLNVAAITNVASSITSFLVDKSDASYGRALSVKGGTAGDNAVITLKGRDYLGQPMAEAITLNGITAVNGKKAFFWLDQVDVAAGNANASTTLSVGFTNILGLPFTTVKVMAETSYASGVATVQTVGTLVAAVATTPTSTTGDVRGTYTPTVTLNGSTEVVIHAIADAAVTSGTTNVGLPVISGVLANGLHGPKQFYP